MKIDNIFKRTVSDKIFSEQYDVPSGKYKCIADGINSKDCHVKMLASILKAVDVEVEKKKSEQRIRNQDTAIAFTDAEKSSLYKKVLKQLQTEFLSL